jgi:hypothetical protein
MVFALCLFYDCFMIRAWYKWIGVNFRAFAWCCFIFGFIALSLVYQWWWPKHLFIGNWVELLENWFDFVVLSIFALTLFSAVLESVINLYKWVFDLCRMVEKFRESEKHQKE